MTDTSTSTRPTLEHPATQGRRYWMSLEHLANTPAIQQRIADEFSGYDPDAVVSMSRRGFLGLMGASMALAGLGLSGCRRWPKEQVVEFAARPEGFVPGEATWYATSVERLGVSNGLLAKSFDGRPIKIEGNPAHPYSLGAANAYDQSLVLEVYDPDRNRGVLKRTGEGWQASDWAAFDAAMAQQLDHGGVFVLTQASASPTMERLKARLAAKGVSFHHWERLHRDHEVDGAKLAFDGRALRPIHHLEKARTIVFVGGDPLRAHPAQQRLARGWAASRRGADRGAGGEMSRTFAIESAFTSSGASADVRIAVKPSEAVKVLETVGAALGVAGCRTHDLHGATRQRAELLVADLKHHGRQSVFIVGPEHPAAVHALAYGIAAKLGSLGETITFVDEPACCALSHTESITSLVKQLDAGEVKTLLILGGNPVYDAPVELRLNEKLSKAGFTAYLGGYVNETAQACGWALPEAHVLESFGDGRAWDGTLTAQQPLILPMWNGRSGVEQLAVMAGEAHPDGRSLVQETLRELGGPSMEVFLRDGVAAGIGWERVAVPTVKNVLMEAALVGGQVPAVSGDGFELVLTTSAIHDGRYANLGWLQEAPDPMSKLTWGNAAILSFVDAKRLGVTDGDEVMIGSGPASMKMPVYVMPGVAEGTVVSQLGYGRTAAGHVGNGIGFNLNAFAELRAVALSVTGKSRREDLASTQDHYLAEGVGAKLTAKRVGEKGVSGYVVKEATLEAYRADPHVVHAGHHADLRLQLFNPPLKDRWDAQAEKLKAAHPEAVAAGWTPPAAFNESHAWGMTIDMSACTGCGACVVACQAENNIPIVGKDQVQVNREMHWLRIDRYFKGAPEDPDVVHMPVMCVHCENAPCEQVCPVAATVHDTEGLNTMVYNRCIGTRYCSNNCPYKVRRFNYFDYHTKGAKDRTEARDPNGKPVTWINWPDTQHESLVNDLTRMVYNPSVTVRMRGVMEKCTYCMQRLQAGKIAAKVAHLNGERDTDTVLEGEVTTACQSACPTQAIVFGNLNDPKAQVSQTQRSPRAYDLLAELNTRPRTKHLARIRNRPDAMDAQKDTPDSAHA